MYKDILVHLDNSSSCEKNLESTVKLAETFDSHVTGLFVIETIQIPAYVEVAMGAELLEQNRRECLLQAKVIVDKFQKLMDRHQIKNEARIVDGHLISRLIEQAHYSDLVVVGQENPNDLNDISLSAINQLVMSCGRPVLVVPYIGSGQTIGNRVLLAWNESREAVRALHDAMPILKSAQEVIVMNVNSKKTNERRLSSDIGVHLARHDINVKISNTISSDLSVGDTLLSRAVDLNVDCIVMGAYGHSRMREVVLGGATRHLLQHMTVPTLFSH